jgi:hypothetical protein
MDTEMKSRQDGVGSENEHEAKWNMTCIWYIYLDSENENKAKLGTIINVYALKWFFYSRPKLIRLDLFEHDLIQTLKAHWL